MRTAREQREAEDAAVASLKAANDKAVLNRPAAWNQDVVEVEPVKPTPKVRRRQYVDIEGLSDGQCKASSWRGNVAQPVAKPTYENLFGPGGYNRCIGDEGHASNLHKDDWGNVFQITETGGFKVVRVEDRA